MMNEKKNEKSKEQSDEDEFCLLDMPKVNQN